MAPGKNNTQKGNPSKVAPLKANDSPDKGSSRTVLAGQGGKAASAGLKRKSDASQASNSKGEHSKAPRNNGKSSGGTPTQASAAGSSKSSSAKKDSFQGGAVSINVGYDMSKTKPVARLERWSLQIAGRAIATPIDCNASLSAQISDKRPSLIFWQEVGLGHNKRGQIFTSAKELQDWHTNYVKEFTVLARHMQTEYKVAQPCISYRHSIWDKDDVFDITKKPWCDARQELGAERFFTALLKEKSDHARNLLLISYHGQIKSGERGRNNDERKRKLAVYLIEYAMEQLTYLKSMKKVCSALIGGDFNVNIDTQTLGHLLQQRAEDNHLDYFEVKVLNEQDEKLDIDYFIEVKWKSGQDVITCARPFSSPLLDNGGKLIVNVDHAPIYTEFCMSTKQESGHFLHDNNVWYSINEERAWNSDQELQRFVGAGGKTPAVVPPPVAVAAASCDGGARGGRGGQSKSSKQERAREAEQVPTKSNEDPNAVDKVYKRWHFFTTLMDASRRGELVEANNILGCPGIDLNKKSGGNPAHRLTGSTALVWASKFKRAEIVKCLLQAGADPDLVNNQGKTALMLASENGSVEVVQALLKKNADVNAVDAEEKTALMMASENGHVEVVQALLGKKAGIDAVDEEGKTALMMASENGHVEVVQALLNKNADVNAVDAQEKTALMMASENGHVEVVQALLNKNADIDAVDAEEKTALMMASENGHVEVVQALLGKKAGIDAVDAEKKTALMMASENGHVEVVQALLNKNADVNAVDAEEKTALMMASENSHVEVVQALLNKNADVDAVDEEGKTALMMASENGSVKVVQALLDAGADVNVVDGQRRTAIIIASSNNGQPDIVNILLDHKTIKHTIDLCLQSEEADILHQLNVVLISASQRGWQQIVERLVLQEVADADGVTLLMMASKHGLVKVVKSLLGKNADVDAVDAEEKKTALMMASENGHVEVVQALLGKNPDVDAVDAEEKKTALMMASEKGHVEVVQALLGAGADVNVIDEEGDTALMLACGRCPVQSLKEVVTSLLQQKNSNVDVQNELGYTALIHTCRRGISGSSVVAATLIEYGANANLIDKRKRTALHWAASLRREVVIELVNILLLSSVDVGAKDDDGDTSLMLACSKGITKAVNSLLERSPDIAARTAALQIASSEGHVETVNALLKAPVEVNAQNDEGKTALMMASEHGHVKVVIALLRGGAQADRRALQIARDHEQTAIVYRIRRWIRTEEVSVQC